MSHVACLACGSQTDGAPGSKCVTCGGVLVNYERLRRFSELGLDVGGAAESEAGAPSERLQAGATFLRYRIESVVGEGAMGVVYRARDPRLRRSVALKILKPELFTSAQLLARFQREAELAGRLRHPSVVTVFDSGVHEGHAYFTMEFVDAHNLRDLLQERHRFPPQLALHVAITVGEALGYAHRQGVIHRDIKPSNILIESVEQAPRAWAATDFSSIPVLVTDFGVARDVAADTHLTRTDAVLGTPAYMAPEQVGSSDQPLDGRADQYGLGTVLYEMLSGAPPFDDKNVHRLLLRITTEEPRPIRQRVPTLDRDVETIVMKMLAKEPSRRYASCEEMAKDISRFLRGESILARPVSLPERAWRGLRKRRVVAATAAVSLLLVAAVLIYFLAVKPGLERRREERHLETLVEQKLELESKARGWLAEAEQALAAKDLERCIERCTQIEETTAPLVDAGVAPPDGAAGDPRFAVLTRAYDFPLAEAYLLRARAHADERRQELDRSLEYSALAYYTAVMGGPAHADTAKEALLFMGGRFEASGQVDRAVGAYRTVRRQFAGSVEAARAAMRLVPCVAAREEYKLALTCSARAQKEKQQLSKLEQGSVERMHDLLARFFPVREASMPAGLWTVADLDGDGRAELGLLDNLGILTVTDLESGRAERHEMVAPAELKEGGSSLWAPDLDGDGRSELVLFHGDAWKKDGFLAVYRWSDGPHLLHREPMGAYGAECWITTGDLDGDGRPEAVAGIGYFVRELHVSRLDGDRWTLLDRIPLESDPLAAVCANLDDVPGDEILLSIGGWKVATGYQIRICRWKGPQTLTRAATLPSRTFARRIFVSQGALYLQSVHYGDQRNVLETMAQETDVLPPGLYRIPLRGVGFADPKPIAPAFPGAPPPPTLHGVWKGKVLSSWGGASLRLNETVLPLGRGAGAYRFVEVDGDRDPEILRVRDDRREARLTLFGTLPPAEDEAASDPRPSLQPAEDEAASDPRHPLLAAVEDLLALGFAKVAIELCDSRRARGLAPDLAGWLQLRRGEALLELGRVDDAIRTFRAAAARYPSLIREAALAEADVLESEGRWPELDLRLGEILETVALPPGVRTTQSNRKKGAAQMASLRTAIDWDSARLWVEDPSLLRREAEGWVWYAPAVGPASHAALFRFDGKSFRLRFRLRLERTDWETGFALGFARVAGRDPLAFDRTCAVRLYVRFTGASRSPVQTIRLAHAHPQAGTNMTGTRQDRFEANDRWTVVIEYAQHLRRLRGVLERADGTVDEFDLADVDRLPEGEYALLLESGSEGATGTQYWSKLLLEEWTVETAAGRSEVESWIGANLRTALLRGHGHLSRGERVQTAAELARAATLGGGADRAVVGIVPPRQFLLLQRGLLAQDAGLLREVAREIPLQFLYWLAARHRFLDAESFAALRTAALAEVSGGWVEKLVQAATEEPGQFPAAVGNAGPEIETALKRGEPGQAFALFARAAFGAEFASAMDAD